MFSGSFRIPHAGDVFRPLSGKGAGEDWGKEFVVVENHYDRGGEYVLDTYSITAQQLHEDGSFNPEGKTIRFSMTQIETVEVLRTMRKVFV